jgi:hypothetical protein
LVADGWTRRTRSRSSDPDGCDGEDEARELQWRVQHSPALGLDIKHLEGVSSAAALVVERAHPLHDDVALNAPDSTADDDVRGRGRRASGSNHSALREMGRSTGSGRGETEEQSGGFSLVCGLGE